jgi:hypothetical protein
MVSGERIDTFWRATRPRLKYVGSWIYIGWFVLPPDGMCGGEVSAAVLEKE